MFDGSRWVMADQKEKFSWKEGGVLDEKSSEPLGDVRQHGLPKISKSVAADPVTRKEEREDYLASQQSQSYQKRTPAKKSDGTIIIEESHSGISGEFEDSEVKHLTDKGKKMRGLDFFGKK